MVTTDVDYWLEQLRLRSWSLYFFGPDRYRPDLMAAAQTWDVAVDVVVIHSENYAVAWRTPRLAPDLNPFAPDQVTWWYAATTNRTLRFALTLDPPGRECLPTRLEPAPAQCQVPPEFGRGMTFRPAPGGPATLYTP
jgi:hypothetical protein